jgi:hypothetical protein
MHIGRKIYILFASCSVLALSPVVSLPPCSCPCAGLHPREQQPVAAVHPDPRLRWHRGASERLPGGPGGHQLRDQEPAGEQSLSMGVKLKNRKLAEAALARCGGCGGAPGPHPGHSGRAGHRCIPGLSHHPQQVTALCSHGSNGAHCSRLERRGAGVGEAPGQSCGKGKAGGITSWTPVSVIVISPDSAIKRPAQV